MQVCYPKQFIFPSFYFSYCPDMPLHVSVGICVDELNKNLVQRQVLSSLLHFSHHRSHGKYYFVAGRLTPVMI